jgi:hypothetical protein
MMPNRVLAAAAIALVVTACDRPDPSVVGSWTAAEAATQWTLDMRSDSTYVMRVGDLDGEGTFTEIPDGDAVQLHATGDLAQVMPGGFQAHLDGDTLRLCNVTGCQDMVRVRDR